MRIVFMGTPEFAVPSLEALIAGGHEVAAVFTQPDRPKGRGNRLAPSPVKVAALRAGIPVFQPEKIRRDGFADLQRLAPELCVTAAFGQILSKEVLQVAPKGNINVHASLLPRHRGAAPIAQAIRGGDRVTGVTTMWMDEGIDTGDILKQAQTEIGETETCGELTERLSRMGATLLMETLAELEAGMLRNTPQREEEMSYDPMLKKEDGLPDFCLPAELVRGQINGMNPWPCVSVPMGEGRLKLLRAAKAEGCGRPGTVLAANPKEGLIIACGEGAVRVLEVQAPGGKRMKTEDFLRGHAMDVGCSLTEQ